MYKKTTMRVLKGFIVMSTLIFPAAAPGAGNIEIGKKVFNKCKACHSIKPGKHKIGPSLHGVFGRVAGSAPGFRRYRGLKGANWKWNKTTLDEYLTDPKVYVRKNNNKRRSGMVLKLKKKRDRQNIIEYLKLLK